LRINRQQRRQRAKELAKENRTALTDTEILKLKKRVCDEVYDDIRDEVVNQVLNILSVVLHDDYGFGQKRCIKVLEHINLYFDNIKDKEITFDDVAECCRDEIGINIMRRQ